VDVGAVAVGDVREEDDVPAVEKRRRRRR